MPRVVIVDPPSADTSLERAVAEQHGASFIVHVGTGASEARDAVRGADIVLVNLMPMDAETLRELNPRAVVIRYGVGTDNIDLSAAERLNITVANATGYGVETVAEHAASCLIALLRRLPHFTASIRSGDWPSAATFGAIQTFTETTIGLIGAGEIGLALAARLRGFGFRLLAHDSRYSAGDLGDHGVTVVGLTQLLEESDAVSLHVPLVAETRGLVDTRRIKSMRPNAVLVNTSRGGVVDEGALIEALRAGHLAGAALDVFEEEPLPMDSPLRRLDNVILTPHVGYYSSASMLALQRLVSEELDLALRGVPLKNRVGA